MPDDPTFPIPSQPLPSHLSDPDEGDGGAGLNEAEAAELLGSMAVISHAARPTVLPPVEFTIIRELTEDDLSALARPAKATQTANVVRLHSRHHQIAQLVAQGLHLADVALISGYTVAFVSQLQHNPAFAALVAHYSGVGEVKAVDAIERLKALGVEATEVLQERLGETPDGFSNRELTELVDLAIVRPHVAAMKAAGGVAAANAQPRQFQVVFRSAAARPGDGTVIEGEREAG
jgi:hypothetical protein